MTSIDAIAFKIKQSKIILEGDILCSVCRSLLMDLCLLKWMANCIHTPIGWPYLRNMWTIIMFYVLVNIMYSYFRFHILLDKLFAEKVFLFCGGKEICHGVPHPHKTVLYIFLWAGPAQLGGGGGVHLIKFPVFHL